MTEFNPDKPFGGVLGSTAELQILDLLLSMPKHPYNIAELSRASELARGTCDRVVKHLTQWRLLDVAESHANVTSYRVNELSAHIAALRDFHMASLDFEPEWPIEPATTTHLWSRLVSGAFGARKTLTAFSASAELTGFALESSVGAGLSTPTGTTQLIERRAVTKREVGLIEAA